MSARSKRTDWSRTFGIVWIIILISSPVLAWPFQPQLFQIYNSLLAMQLKDDDAGITIQPLTGLTTREDGSSDYFSVSIHSEPEENVAVLFTSSNAAEGIVLPDNITFTRGNWRSAQTVTITGVDDNQIDGDIGYEVIAALSTGDKKYRSIQLPAITVTNLDDDLAALEPPIAVADTYGINQDSILLIPEPGVLKNDQNPDGNPALTAQLVQQVSNGTLVFNTNGAFQYTPNQGFSGQDTFQYQAISGDQLSNITTVTINILAANLPPVANNDTYMANMNTSLTVSAAAGVLSNDSDPENSSLTAVLEDSPSHGTLAFGSDGSFVYTPFSGYLGADQFTYKASDGTLDSNIATVSITVQQTNLPPVASSDSYLTNEAVFVSQANGLLKNDYDPDGSSISVHSNTMPANGSVQINPDGSFTYTPNAGFDGTDTFTYTITDGQLTSAPVSVSIRVDITPPAPASWIEPVGNGEIAEVNNDTVTLEVQPSAPTADLARVVFLRWDAQTQTRVEIASLPGAPYRVTIQASSLRPGWNQVDAVLVDHAGNNSAYQHVWLVYNVATQNRKIFLPLILRP